MSHAEKSAYYHELKRAGVKFDRTYQQYTTDELATAVRMLREKMYTPAGIEDPVDYEADSPQDAGVASGDYLFEIDTPQPSTPDNDRPTPNYTGVPERRKRYTPKPPEPTWQSPEPTTPVQARPATQHQSPTTGDAESSAQGLFPSRREADTEAGLRQNQPDLRVDANGWIWHQDEIRKPAYPKPRKRRVLKYIDPGVKQQTIKAGDYMETFEVAGDESRESEVRISLPSYQVGIYEDPRFKGFKIHVYNDQRAFDLQDVQNFYGGAELVPGSIKRVYIANDLCYDIRSLVRAMEWEARQNDLAAGRGGHL